MIGTRTWTTRSTTIVATLALAFLLALVLGVAGCGDKDEPVATPKSAGAKAGLPVARSALSTMAPDAKLLLVQTATSVSGTSSPVWAYLFGSPESDKTFVVYVTNGNAMSATEYGLAGLSDAEWTEVPDIDDWAIDSDEAYKIALEKKPEKLNPTGYSMGFLTYIPSTDASSTTKPLVWYVILEPGASGVETATIQVDAKTGEAKVD